MLTDEAIPHARNYALDFYRFLFSCVICIMHFTAYMDFGDAHAPFCGGYLAVEFFFIVSGYMLMRHVEREKKKAGSVSAGRCTARYAWERFERLFPHYALSLILVALVYIYVGQYSTKEVLTSVFWEFFMVQSAGLPFVVNNQFWYVSAMLLASVFIHFLLKKNEDTYQYIIAPGALLLICGYFYQTYGYIDLTMRSYDLIAYSGLWRAFAEIGLGCIVYTCSKKLANITGRLFRVLVTFLEGSLLVVILYTMYRSRRSIKDFAMIGLIAAFVLCVSLGKSYVDSFLNTRVSGFLGKISYGMYLNQLIFIVLISTYIPEKPFWPMALVFLLANTLFSAVTTWGCAKITALLKKAFCRAPLST